MGDDGMLVAGQALQDIQASKRAVKCGLRLLAL
jgi:hypothetical protein